jgi:hypothetical protein
VRFLFEVELFVDFQSLSCESTLPLTTLPTVGNNMTTLTRLILIAVVSIGFTLSVGQLTTAQDSSPTVTATPSVQIQEPFVANEVATPEPSETRSYLSGYEFKLTLIVTLVSLVTLVMEFLLLRTAKNLRSEDILRVFGVTLIILGALFFVTVGYDANQVAPAIGLFGTVAGYLLGRSNRRNDSSTQD